MSLIDDVKNTAMNKKVISGGLGSIFGYMLADKYNLNKTQTILCIAGSHLGAHIAAEKFL